MLSPCTFRQPCRESARTANLQKNLREYAKEKGLRHFYDVSEGICHQVFMENGHALPGQLIMGRDSSTRWLPLTPIPLSVLL